MTSLIVLGNTNQETFANSIVAANAKAKELFGNPLDTIYVIHSIDSDKVLRNSSDWINHLKSHNIEQHSLIYRTIEITTSEESIQLFVEYLESILKSISEEQRLMVDLSNGTTFQRSLLSIAAYVLELENQNMIDYATLRKVTLAAGIEKIGFVNQDLLLQAYIPAPNSTQLDNVAYLNLSEIVRYKRIIQMTANRFVDVQPELADRDYFEKNLAHSIQFKLKADKTADNALYRIAAMSIAGSVEELISLMLKKLALDENADFTSGKTLGQKINKIGEKVNEINDSEFDIEFFRKFNDFILYLRNSTTHKGKLLSDVERFKAELAVKMSFPFIDFYSNIVLPALTNTKKSPHAPIIRKIHIAGEVNEDTKYYYGLDGDDTGAILEEMFLSSQDDKTFRRLSTGIEKAIDEICNLIKKTSGAEVIFAAGDDILFKGCFRPEQLFEFQQIYKQKSGLNCSIGYGQTLKEVYMALKLAKTHPGKNSIEGVEIR